ncbi:hypothetical protein IQ63_11390 [Streptomyces acidiscabies]|uniref:Uncharacterized protein n=1 Tax=Streptomyces acidiscabies TaxID=42234 RepID=A0A0L0KG64_9ACTN|nr:hypothetical protein IQ63_11390 [Streptomyces acidiscabies]
MVRDQPHQTVVGAALVAKKPRTVQRMEPRDGQPRRVTHIVQSGSGNEQSGILADDPAQFNRTFSHSPCMRPAPGKRRTQFGFRYAHGPPHEPFSFHQVLLVSLNDRTPGRSWRATPPGVPPAQISSTQSGHE